MKLLIPTSKVGLLIGPKFKTINAIQNREGSLQQIGGGNLTLTLTPLPGAYIEVGCHHHPPISLISLN